MAASRVTSLCCVNGRWAFICQYLTHGRRCGCVTHKSTIKPYNTRWGGGNGDRAWDKIQLLLVTQCCRGDKARSSEELSQLVFDLI